jgi:hypothetical protein
MYGQGIPGIDEYRGIDESFIASFRLLTSLEILSIGESTSPLDAKVHGIVTSEILKNGCRLRYINCSGDPNGFEKLSVPETVQYQYESLEVLCIALMAYPGASTPIYFSAKLPSYTLSSLHTLHINSNLRSNILEWISTWDLPSLQSCRLPVVAQSPGTHTSDFLPFFKAHGEKITTLSLDELVTASCLLLILRHCPVIQEFTIPPQSFIDISPHTTYGLVALQFPMHAIFNRNGIISTMSSVSWRNA